MTPEEVIHACEGDCEITHGEHSGEVKKVIVSASGWQPMTFYYCSNAIEEDNRRGFTVEMQED